MKLFILLFFSIGIQAQNNWITNKSKVIIPFELSNNLILIDMKINETKFKMIVDSGSEKNLLFSFPEDEDFEVANLRKIKILGMGFGDTLQAFVSTANKAQIKSIENSNFEILLITDRSINIVNKLGLPVNGILGATFFKDFVLHIDYEKLKINLYPKTRKSLVRKKSKYQELPISLYDDIPYLNLKTQIENEKFPVKLLFDTGLSDGLWLFEDHQIVSSSHYFTDVLGKGLSGDIYGKKSRVKKLQMDNFLLNEALVSYPDTSFILNKQKVINRNGSLGGEVIKRFNWILDYKNKTFYYKKNSNFDLPFHYNMSGISVQQIGYQLVTEEINNGFITKEDIFESHFDSASKQSELRYNYFPLYEIYALRNDSPAFKAGLQIGDRILSINGKSSKKYDIQKINDLFQSEEGKLITIEVNRKGKTLKFKFKLEKIL